MSKILLVNVLCSVVHVLIALPVSRTLYHNGDTCLLLYCCSHLGKGERMTGWFVCWRGREEEELVLCWFGWHHSEQSIGNLVYLVVASFQC